MVTQMSNKINVFINAVYNCFYTVYIYPVIMSVRKNTKLQKG